MASFRVRTPAEYLRILWRRRYYIFVPFVIVSATLCYVIYRLPNIYESSTLIIVDPPKVSQPYVQPVNQVDFATRLGVIQQHVTSRTELEGIIEMFNLYPELRRANLPRELILEEMRKHIKLSVRSVGGSNNAFTISFLNTNPVIAQSVTRELATRFINANSEDTIRRIRSTNDQIENRIADLKKQLEETEAKRNEYLQNHPEAVPGQDQSLASQMGSLTVLIGSLRTSISSLQNQLQTYEQQLTMIRTQVEADPETPLAVGQAEGQLRVKKAELEGKLKELLSQYTDKHPDVISTRALLEGVNRELEDLKTRSEQERATRVRTRRNNAPFAELELRIAATKRELEQKQAELNQANQQYNELSARLRAVPLLTTEAQKIDRDYNILRKHYDELVSQRENARFSQRIVESFSGETFTLKDPANLPEVPVSPKRALLYPFSLVLGLALGIAIAFAVEARYLFTIQDARDVAHYTHLPLLVTVPELLTTREQKLRTLLHAAQLMGVVVLILVSVPLLVKIIRYFGITNLFTGTY